MCLFPLPINGAHLMVQRKGAFLATFGADGGLKTFVQGLILTLYTLHRMQYFRK